MKVVIPLAALQAAHACDVYLQSPEWDEGAQALVYPDWAATIERHFAAGRRSISQLGWLVAHDLVPMTRDEFVAMRKTRGGTHV